MRNQRRGDPHRVYSSAVQQAVVQMRENLHEEWRAEDIAAAMRFSLFHSNRIFRTMTGVTPGRFLAALRLEESKKLLLDSAASVSDVCTMVGYRSVGSYVSLFKRRVGLTPNDFRVLARHTSGLSVGALYDRLLLRHEAAAVTTITDVNQGRLMFVGLFNGSIPAADVVAPRNSYGEGVTQVQSLGYVLDKRTLLGDLPRGALAEASKLAVAGKLDPEFLGTDAFRAPALVDPPVLVDVPLLLAKGILS